MTASGVRWPADTLAAVTPNVASERAGDGLGFWFSDPGTVSAICVLDAKRESVRAAREFASDTLQNWRLGSLFDDVSLVVSELVTNALRHGIGLMDDAPVWGAGGPVPKVRLRMLLDGHYVICAVEDPNDEIPIRRHPDYISEHGRGLCLVEACSRRWGWGRRDAGGKVVWALFCLPQGCGHQRFA